jgi:hypothetical protein
MPPNHHQLTALLALDLQALAVPWVGVCASGASGTDVWAGPRLTAARLELGLSHVGGKGEDLGRGLLGCDDDQSRGIRGDHAGEDGGVDNEEVVSAVDSGVEIDDSGAAVTSIISTDLGRADPVVGATVTGGNNHLFLC